MLIKILLCLVLLFSTIECYSIDNKRLLRIEPISTAKVDIAPRSENFFVKRDISPNSHYVPRARAVEYDDTLRLTIDAFNQTIYLHLTPNHELFHPDAVFHQNGQSNPLRPSDFRVYKGYAIEHLYSEHWWISNPKDFDALENQPGIIGWARIIIRNDIKHNLDHPLFEGAFTVHGNIHHIKLKDTYRRTKRSDDADVKEIPNTHMVIYRDSDMVIKNQPINQSTNGCGFDNLVHTDRLGQKIDFNPLELNDPYSIRHTRPFVNTLSKRAPEGCPTAKKMLYMGVAADCTYTKFYKSTDGARMQIINDWNSVSMAYTNAFNIGIGLINITIMDSSCPATASSSATWNQACSTAYSISQRLSDFSRWRGSIGNDGAGLWHLMTTCATGPEVGIAWMSQVCNTKAISSSDGYTSGTGVSSVITDEWKVVAHEIGHGFGAIHDCNAQSCPCAGGASCNCCPYSSTQCDAGGRYFMNPTSNASSSEFSPCSISTICKNVPTFQSCLLDPGSKNVTTLKMCGNGIKEDGEDCDTGGQPSNCCDPATCKFKPNAVCDDFNDLCCNNCQFRPANYTCRPASTECDIAEVCSGTSGNCPPDSYKDDLTNCGNGMQCASGQCTSRDAQCLARGTTSNIKKACGSYDGCQVTCQHPTSSMMCIEFPGYFLDGTPCGIGGICKSGKCNLDNFGNNVKSWIDNHKQIVIPVAIVAGILLLSCLFCCCCNPRGNGYNNLGSSYVITQAQPQYAAQPPYYPPPPPPPMGNQPPYYTPPQSGWVDPALYNGQGNNVQPPLPAYSQHDPRQHDSYELNNASNWQNRTNSPAPQPQQIPTPTPPPLPPQHNTNNRPYNEGVI